MSSRAAPLVEQNEFGNSCPDLWPRKASSCERRRRPSGPALADLHGNETVLVLNPVASIRKAVVDIMRQFGYRTIEAAGAVQAQRKVRLRPDINLLFLDQSGLQTDDLQLALWFRVMYPAMKVLVASASVWEMNFHLGIPEQIVFLPKPFTAFELARVMRETLD
jgi:DNA-binding NtrC family response regulator